MVIRCAGSICLCVIFAHIEEIEGLAQFVPEKGPVFGAGTMAEEEAAKHGELLEVSEVDWNLLRFWNDRQIKEIEVHFDESFVTRIPIKIKCTDRKSIKALESTLRPGGPMRMAIGDGADGGWGHVPVGHILVKCTDGEFVIGINPSGFALSEKSTRFQNVFYSYFLAHLVDDLYFQKTGKHLPEEPIDLREKLSGQSWLRDNKRTWEEWRDKKRG